MIRSRIHPRKYGFLSVPPLGLRPGAGAVLAVLFFLSAPLMAATGHLTEADRIAILRTLIAKSGTARVVFPQGKKGVNVLAGQGVTNLADAQQQALNMGPAAKVGGRVAITAIRFENRKIIFEVNGGPAKVHWYNHISVGMGAGMTPVGTNHAMAQGSEVELLFPHGIPHLTPDQVMSYLNPAIDWAPHPLARVMVRKIPAPVKKAIRGHQVLVGMDTAMVIAAVGRTNLKFRQQDPKTGEEYEEWVYGKPPESLFVKLEGDRVVETIAYHRDGTRVVQNQPQITLPKPPGAPGENNPNRPSLAGLGQASGQSGNSSADNQRPTLRRPGDNNNGRTGPRSPVFLPSAGNPMPGDPGAPGGMPGQMPGGQMPSGGQMPGGQMPGGQMPGGQIPPA